MDSHHPDFKDPSRMHLTWHEHAVSRAQRERAAGHRSCLVWFTGLSGSGKSTVANLVDHKLHALGARSFVLDGDNVRLGLCATPAQLRDTHGEPFAERFGLGFSEIDRQENIRRIGAVAELLCMAGMITLCALVSPYRRDRDLVRQRLGKDFLEVFVDAPLALCESRDPKGLYKKARAGEIRDFTGIDAPYEPPLAPELHLDATRPAEELADQVIGLLYQTAILPRPAP
jgi:adenylylsulfate kinase